MPLLSICEDRSANDVEVYSVTAHNAWVQHATNELNLIAYVHVQMHREVAIWFDRLQGSVVRLRYALPLVIFSVL